MRCQKGVILFCVLLAGATAWLSAVQAAVTIQPRNRSVFQNKDCKKNGTCDLVKVEWRWEDFTVVAKWGKEYGTRFFSSYTTKKVADLEKYVFVQFLRGCMWETERLPYGGILIRYYNSQLYFNSLQLLFIHPDWEIDSIDDNPIYFSVPGKPSHYYYRWDPVSGPPRLYGEAKPSRPTLYVFDRLGPVGAEGNKAGNISVQVRTCLFKTKDVPETIHPNEIDFGKPIVCFEWGSSLIYNHKKAKYESLKGLSPVCDYCGPIPRIDSLQGLEIIDGANLSGQPLRPTD